MKKSYKYLVVIVLSLTFFGCQKKEKDYSPNRTNNSVNEKTIKNVRPTSLVLVPNATRPRIAFMPDGSDFLGVDPYMDGTSLRDGIYTSPGVMSREIYNPNQFLGLPVDIGGIVFSGLALDRTANYYDPPIILSRSRSSEHALFFASVNPASNYNINSYVIVNSSFAPAGSGWRLSYIEYHSQVMFGIFYNSSTQESKIAQIDVNTGNTTFIKSFPGVKFEGMDFTVNTTYPNIIPDKMYLKSGVAAGITTCKIYTLDLTNPASYSTVPTTIPTNYLLGGSASGSFLIVSNHTSPIYIYEPWDYTIHGYDPSTNTSNTYVTGKKTVTLTNPVTLGPFVAFGGQAMNDAAR